MKIQFKTIVLFIFLIFNNINAQSNSKTLTINWPKEEGWHIVDQQNNDTGTITTITSLKGKEFIGNSSESVTTYIYHDSKSVPIETEIEGVYQSLKKQPE